MTESGNHCIYQTFAIAEIIPCILDTILTIKNAS